MKHDKEYIFYIFIKKQTRLFIKFKCYLKNDFYEITDCTEEVARLAGFECKKYVAMARCNFWTKPRVFHDLKNLMEQRLAGNVIFQIIHE